MWEGSWFMGRQNHYVKFFSKWTIAVYTLNFAGKCLK